MRQFAILVGDVRDRLKDIPDGTVQCVVTSPPYFGLRDYGVEGQIGLETRPDCLGWATGVVCGECFVCTMVAVFREVRRVLRDDGTVWLNLGDSYAAQRGGTAMPAETLAGGNRGYEVNGRGHRGRRSNDGIDAVDRQAGKPSTAKLAHRDAAAIGFKHKDLMGVPWRVALALQADGWYLRSDVIWHKPNPMPESVTDRPTKSHEYVFLLAKSERYFFDKDAVMESGAGHSWSSAKGFSAEGQAKRGASVGHTNGVGFHSQDIKTGRNIRSVWTITTKPFAGAHFATFPEDLPSRCILAGSRVGSLVLDPFNGAGTTGVVALGLDRRYVGIELNPQYAEMARARILERAGPLITSEVDDCAGLSESLRHDNVSP